MKFRRIAAALLTLALGFCLCLPAAFAADGVQKETLNGLKVSIQSTGETPLPKETLTVELKAVTAGAPMPEQTTLDITDGDSAAFGPITYTTPGSYKYTVTQRAGDNSRGEYDDTVYYVVVNALWNGNKFEVQAVVFKNADLTGEKAYDVVFNNHYKAINTPIDPNPYDPDPNPNPPTPTTPENPAPADARPATPETTNPSAPEPSTPDTVVADARPEGPKLIQTGQLNWPVPVLTGSGLVLVAVGGWLLHRSKKRDENA